VCDNTGLLFQVTTTDEIMANRTMSTIDGMKCCIDALEKHARELERELALAREAIEKAASELGVEPCRLYPEI
jgi:chemotaxis regulatin CheY-phosphate phosphatase CheZ